MDKNKVWRIALVAVGAVFCILFVVLLLPRLLIWFLPFVLAFFLFKIMEPFVRFLKEKLKIPRKIGSAIGVFLTVGIVGALVFFLVGRIWQEINDIIDKSDVLLATFSAKYKVFRDGFAARFGLDDELDRVFSGMGQQVSEYAASYAAPAIRGAFNVVMGVPAAILFTVVLVLATYFMSSDKEKISKGLQKVTSEKVTKFLSGLVGNVFSALGAYVKAQLVLICITFCELTVGFLIIGGTVADYALVLALVISIIDAIPILGIGGVLIPWGVYALIVGDIRLGILLLVLYLICLTVRQIIEPRLVAHQIGVHPLIMLMVMYIGLRSLGFLGLILGPVLALVVKKMCGSGLFTAITGYVRGDEKTKNQ